MQKSKGLSLQIAGSVALAMMFGTSAFAESRHLGGTRGGGSSHSSSRGFSGSHSFSGSRGGFSGSHSFSGSRGGFSGSRSFSGSRGGFSGSRSFSGSRGGFSGSRGSSGSRFGSRGSSAPRSGGRSTPAPRFGSRAPSSFGRNQGFRGQSFYNSGSRFYGRGRIDRVVPYRGGYRVWLGGWGYPFFVPYRYYDPFRFRIGLFIGFNAFYDPLGYYNFCGWPPYYGYPPVYSGGYRGIEAYRDNDNAYSDTVVRGVVESIDLHLGTVVINDDASHRVITALLPPRDSRVDDIRPGDWVEFSGGWTHSGQFDADRMDRFEQKR